MKLSVAPNRGGYVVGSKAKQLTAIEQAGRSIRRRNLGCWAIILAPIALFIAAIVGASRENAEWDRLRPQSLTVQNWQALREQCETVRLDPAECASTPKQKVERLAAAQLAAERAELCARDDDVGAKQQAEEAVRASLKSPSTAVFGESRVRHKGCRWFVSGDVDAQNGFGAMLRSSYRVELLRTAKDKWLPLSVRVGE